MEIDLSRVWLYELSAILHSYIKDNLNNGNRFRIPVGCKVLFLFEPDIMTNKVGIKVRIDNIYDTTNIDDYLKERCNFLENGRCIADLIDEFGYHNVLWEYDSVDADTLEATISYLRLVIPEICRNSLWELFYTNRTGERLRLKIRSELAKFNSAPRTFSFGDLENFGFKQLSYRTQEDAERAKTILDNYAFYTKVDKASGKIYKWKLEFKISKDVLLTLFFADDNALKDLKRKF